MSYYNATDGHTTLYLCRDKETLLEFCIETASMTVKLGFTNTDASAMAKELLFLVKNDVSPWVQLEAAEKEIVRLKEELDAAREEGRVLTDLVLKERDAHHNSLQQIQSINQKLAADNARQSETIIEMGNPSAKVLLDGIKCNLETIIEAIENHD